MKSIFKIVAVLQLCYFATSCGNNQNRDENQNLKAQIEVDSILIANLSQAKSPCTDCLLAAQSAYVSCVKNAGSDQAAKKVCLDNLNSAVAACRANQCQSGDAFTQKNLTSNSMSITEGSELPAANDSDVKKIKNVTTNFKANDLVCGFLQAYGSNYNVTVTAKESRCFTWVFSKNGRVTSMQSIYAQNGQSYNAYSSDGVTIVGISCDCY